VLGLVAPSTPSLYLAPPALAAGGDAPVRVVGQKAAWTMHAGERAPPTRIGFQMGLHRERASRVRWHGRGPHESYPDRQAGARVGVYDAPVAAQTFRYCRPQENGNKLDTRWMALSNDAGSAGLLVVALGSPLSMQCHHFDLDDFDVQPDSKIPRVRHGALLEEKPLTTLCIDGAHAGVGGIDSWGARPLPQHQIAMEQPLEWAFALRPYATETDAEPASLARELA